MTRTGLAVLTTLLIAVTAPRTVTWAQAPEPAPVDASRLRVDEVQVERGRAVYDFHCTTCHGASGAGFAEARAAFPADHYDCSRCHGPGNPPVMTRQQIESTQTVFSLGHAPPLDASSAIDRFADAGALLAYVRAAMPRWAPGRLDDEAYLEVTVYLLRLAYGVRSGGEELDADDLRRVRLDRLR